MITSSEVLVNHLNLGQLPNIYRLQAAQTKTLYRGDILNAEINGMPSKIDIRVQTPKLQKAAFLSLDGGL